MRSPRYLLPFESVAILAVAFASAVAAAEHTKDAIEKVKERLKDRSAVLVDVREKKEWDEGHLEDAVSIPLSRLKKGIGPEKLSQELPKEKIIYCHCAGGVRCLPAADILKKQGYDARPLKAGYNELLKAGFAKSEDELRADLLSQLIEGPRLDVLQELLHASGGDELELVELFDRTTDIRGKKIGPVWRIPVDDQTLTVAVAKVRPPNTDETTALMAGLPQAAFLFGETGRLIQTFGGHYSPTRSAELAEVINLGPVEDWFIRVERFEDTPPPKHRTDYYRIAPQPIESLRFYGYPNGNPWSYGPEKIIRWGELNFNSFDGPALPPEKLGTTDVGIPMPRTIVWDAEANRFRGAAAVSCDGRALYRVDTQWSREFEPLERKPDQLLSFGGPRDYDSWHCWRLLVPEKRAATLSLRVPEMDAVTATLQPGLRVINLQVKADPQINRTSMDLRVSGQEGKRIDAQGELADEQPEHLPIVRLLDPPESIQLLEVRVTGSETPISLTVTLP